MPDPERSYPAGPALDLMATRRNSAGGAGSSVTDRGQLAVEQPAGLRTSEAGNSADMNW